MKTIQKIIDVDIKKIGTGTAVYNIFECENGHKFTLLAPVGETSAPLYYTHCIVARCKKTIEVPI